MDRTTDLEMARTEASMVVRTINALWTKQGKTQGEWDALEAAQARLGYLIGDLVGFMDENLVDSPDGERSLANMIWKFRGHSYPENLVTNEIEAATARMGAK